MSRTARARKPYQSGNAINRDVIAHILMTGVGFVWRNNTAKVRATRPDGSAFWLAAGEPGSPDVIGLLKDGRFIGIETKAQGDKMRLSQEIFRDRVQEMNGLYLVVHDLDDLIEQLDTLLKSKESDEPSQA